MKKVTISMLALAAMALGACTSDDIALSENATVGEGGDGYISLAINLPTETSTRASFNDQYDDGLEAEYNVNDAYLLLFDGASEATATCYDIINIGADWETASPENDNITSRKKFTQQVDAPSGQLYALVVINASGVISNPGIPASAMIGTKPVIGATLSDLQTTATALDVATIASVDKSNFYMTNAPLWNGSKGGYTLPTGEVTTLAHIDASKIYDTEAEAKANPATEIYVERGVAKVTINGEDAVNNVENTSIAALSVEGFCLDLTNLTAFPVRNTTTNTLWDWDFASGSTDVTQPYRMVGGTEVGADLYRTYWALDPNYNTTLYEAGGTSGNRTYDPDKVLSLVGKSGSGLTLTKADGVTGAYCLDNTFSVQHQNQDETTRAIVAVSLSMNANSGATDFFTLDDIKSTIYTQETIESKVLSEFAENGDVQAAVEASWKGLESEGQNIYNYYAASVDTENGGTRDATVSIGLAEGVNYDDFAALFADGEVPAILDPTDVTGAFAAVVAAINEAHVYSYYAGGVAYYPVLIKHFGDDLTPWDAASVGVTDEPDSPVAGETDNSVSYPENVWGKSSEQNWLGRFGVLRNNWYDITVTGVSEIGSADVPTAYGEPDDPMYHWLSIEINILSWARRTQNVEL